MAGQQRPERRFHHIGLRAFEPQPAEDFVTASKTWVTNPAADPNRIEFLRYEPDCPIDEEFKNTPHVTYAVDDLTVHLAGKDVYLEPFDVGEPPFATVAFTREDGLFIEYMQFKPGPLLVQRVSRERPHPPAPLPIVGEGRIEREED